MKKSINIYNIIPIILTAAFFVVGSYVFRDVKKYYDTKKCYENIKEHYVSQSGKKAGRKIDWNKLYKINDDIAAWVYIPGTPVDYPVLKSKDSDYYLSHDIHKKYSKYGSVFIDESINKRTVESKNLIIFAHNMGHWTDVMFGSLMKYEKADYLKKHKYVYLYIPYTPVQKYKIVSVREVSALSDAYNDDFGKGNLKKWIRNAITQSVVACAGDTDTKKVRKVLTLSTCTYGSNRLVLHCLPEEK